MSISFSKQPDLFEIWIMQQNCNSNGRSCLIPILYNGYTSRYYLRLCEKQLINCSIVSFEGPQRLVTNNLTTAYLKLRRVCMICSINNSKFLTWITLYEFVSKILNPHCPSCYIRKEFRVTVGRSRNLPIMISWVKLRKKLQSVQIKFQVLELGGPKHLIPYNSYLCNKPKEARNNSLPSNLKF